ncbi:MAG: arginase family protein [Thermoleophilaceae bacterium]|nr:arginase family protein [Thermoleophilaceae bacterium]
MSGISLIAHRCRTSDRSAGRARGVDALAPLVGKRLGVEPRAIGTPAEPREQRFDRDLADARGCLLEAGGQVEDALVRGDVPVLLAGECSVGLTTLPAALARRPEARVLWLDAHGDFNTPETTESGYLGGMPLAGACGLWDAGLGTCPIDPARVVLAGVRSLGGPERALLESSPVTVVGASLETLVFTQNALDRAPVYVHVDLDVIDPAAFPAQFPAPGGLAPDKVYDLLEAVAGECEIVGVEVTGFEAPEDELERQAAASTALHVLEPLLDAVAGAG